MLTNQLGGRGVFGVATPREPRNHSGAYILYAIGILSSVRVHKSTRYVPTALHARFITRAYTNPNTCQIKPRSHTHSRLLPADSAQPPQRCGELIDH